MRVNSPNAPMTLLATHPEREQVAEQLQMSPTSVYDLIARGRLVVLRLGPRGGAIRVRGEDLEA